MIEDASEAHAALSRECAALESRIAELRLNLGRLEVARNAGRPPHGFVAGLIVGTVLGLAVFAALACVVVY